MKRNSFLRLFTGVIISVLFSVSAWGQIFPVSVTTQLTPPYSVNLADYAAPGCEQLKVIIVQRDLTQAPYRMYLKMEISLNGQIIMRTTQGYMPFPLTLDPGIPTIISGSDLYPFLDPKNIDFVGYSRETYMRTKSLPEGAYSITFTAYDYSRPEVALSAGGSMFCYLAKNEPPMLNLPANNTGVTALPSQYITFQWLSRATSSPNSAFTTKYRFELFEIRLDGRSPNEIVQSSQPIYTSETSQTSLAYTIADPSLETGMRYAWRVRAFDTEGRDYIRNNGYSEVFNFVYGVADAAALPGNAVENFTAEAISPRKAKLSWDASSEFDSYKVYYRIQNKDDKWYEEESVKNTFDLAGLSPDKIYECRVQGKKNSIWGGFSAIDTLKTPAAAVIACGNPFQSQNIANQEPLKELRRLQEIDAGGFMVTVLEAQGGNGNFSGKGFVQVPLFANRKIRCEFTGITVNTDYQLLQGNIQLLTDKPDGKDNALWDVDNVFEGGSNNGEINEGIEGVAVVVPNAVIPSAEAISLDTTKREILIAVAPGDTVRVDVAQQLEEKAKTITVKDKENNLYSVDTQTGKASYIGKAPSADKSGQVLQASAINGGKGIVYFEASEKTRYAFDKRSKDYSRSSLFSEEYKTMTVPDATPYDIPFKLIPVGETDIVLARAEMKDKTLNPDSIVFQSSTGTQYAAKPSGKKGEYLLTLPSGKDNDGIDVYAVYPNKHGDPYILGKLSVVSYSTKRPKVVLVPVNGNTLDKDKVKEELDKVYLPVAVDWQVSEDEDFSTTVDNLDINGSGLFSQYTEGMKKLNNDFILHKGDDFDPTALYLFVLQYSGDANATGDMPRSKQFGYIFTKTAKQGGDEAIYRTISHELSHGTFRLKHTFDSQYDIAKASTQNLMDYTGGTDLLKHQWDAIHEPGLVIGMFESDEDGMSILSDVYSIIELVRRTFQNKGRCTIPLYSSATLENIYDIGKDKTIKDEFAKQFAGLRFRVQFDVNSIKNKICLFEYKDIEILSAVTNESLEYSSEVSIVHKISRRALITFKCNKSNLYLVQKFLFGDVERDCNLVKTEIARNFQNNEDIDLSKISASCAAELSLDLRKKLINYILNKWIVSETYEHALLVLIEQVKQGDADDFILFLRNEKIGDKFVYQALMSAIDDFNGKEYYAALMQAFTRLLLKKSEYKNGISNAREVIFVGKKPWINFSEVPEFEQRYDKGPSFNAQGNIEVSYKIRFLDDISIIKVPPPGFGSVGAISPPSSSYLTKIEKSYIWEKGESYTYDPLSLVVVSNLSETQNIQSVLLEETSKGVIVPAALLIYNSDKVFQQNIEKGVYITLDVASIILPGGVFVNVGKSISKARKALLLFEVANGVVNLTVNVSQLGDDPKIQKYLLAYNLATAGFNIACATKNFRWIKNSSGIVRGCENISEKLITRFSKYPETTRLAFFKDFRNNKAILNQLDNLSDPEFDQVLKSYNLDLDATSRISVFTSKVASVGKEIAYLSSKGFSNFEQIDDIIILRDANNRIGKVIDKTKLDNITWFTPRSGNTWQIHQLNCSNYLKFKYGNNNVVQQLKVRIYHTNGQHVDCYLDVVRYTDKNGNTKYLISDAKHSQAAALVDGDAPRFTQNQTPGYQWVVDGNAARIEVIGYKGGALIPKQTNLLINLEGRITILTNDGLGNIVESSVFRTRL